MDKSWVNLNRLSPEYEVGLDQFLDIAFEQSRVLGKILCPCTTCQNRHRKTRHVTRLHLIVNGMASWYKMAEQWIHHSETLNLISQTALSSSVPTHDYEDNDVNVMHECLQDIMHQFEDNDAQESSTPVNGTSGPSHEAKRFFKLVEDANTDLYPGQAEHNYEKKTGKKVDRYTKRKICYTRHDGSFVDEHAKRASDAIEKELSRMPLHTQATPEGRNTAFGSVLGNRDRRGRPLGYGLGVRSSELSTSRRKSGKINTLTLEAVRQELTDKYEEYQERLTTMEAEIEQRITKSVEEQVTKRLEEQIAGKQARRKAEVEEYMRQFSLEPSWLTKMNAIGYSLQSQTQGTFERPTCMPQSNYAMPGHYPIPPFVYPSLPQYQGFEESYRSHVASQSHRYDARNEDNGD